MRTFAQKPKATQQITSAKSIMPGRAHVGQNSEVNSIFHLQRTIGNQALQRLLQDNGEGREDSLLTSTSPRFAHDFSRIPVYPGTRSIIQPKARGTDRGAGAATTDTEAALEQSELMSARDSG
jgi:hypothetical protein